MNNKEKNDNIKFVSEYFFNTIPIDRCIERCIRQGVEIKKIVVDGVEFTIVKTPEMKENEFKIGKQKFFIDENN